MCVAQSRRPPPPPASPPRLLRAHARAQGFDEYMNLVLDEAEEVYVKKKTRRAVGRILLKGDTITLMQAAKTTPAAAAAAAA